MTAYVTQEEVLASWDAAGPRPDDADALDRITSLIATASTELDAEVGFTFERNPAVLTATHTISGAGGSRLHLHNADGLAVAPTSISFLDSWGGTPTLVAADDYAYELMDPSTGQYADHVILGDSSSGYTSFPNGPRRIQIVGVRGFDTVPANVKEAVIARVRQLYHADPTLVGGIMGPQETGGVVLSTRPPDVFWRVVEHYRRRYAACWV